MGIGGIGIWQLLIVLVIVLLLFGTKKLKNLGGDLGGAIKGFKKAVNAQGEKADEDDDDKSAAQVSDANASVTAEKTKDEAKKP